MALLDKNQIMEIIPHRDPFLLIDEVEELEIGKRVVAKKFIAPDSFWFRGHFPEHPVTPGVLIVEMLAQAGAVCALAMPENKGKIAFFAGIDKATGMEEFMRSYGFSAAEVAAFGDGGNDIAMLRFAGIGVAMGNANDEVKAMADYVTDDVDHDGIMNALLHFGILQ